MGKGKKIVKPLVQASKSVGGYIGGHSLADRGMGAVTGAFTGLQSGGPVGGILGAVAGAAVGQENISTGVKKVMGTITNPLTPKPIATTTLVKSDTALTSATDAANARNQTLGQSILDQQAATAARTTPQMEAQMIDRAGIGNVLAQQTGPGTAVAMDTSGVQRVGAQTGAQMQSAQIEAANQAQMRQQQLDLASQLQAQASGTAPSIAVMQAKQAGERALAAQMAVQAGQSGSAAPLAQRTAARNQASIGADIANQSGILRLQEQQQAQKALGELAGTVRGQDIGLATSQAQMEQASRTANLQSQVADFDRSLRADLANQGVDLDKAKLDAANGNAMALANLSVATQNADRLLKADLANQGIDFDVLKANAAAGNAAALANLQAALQKMGLDDAMQRAYMQNQLELNKQQTDQAMDTIRIQSAENQKQADLDQQRAIAQAAGNSQLLGAGVGAVGALGAAYIAKSDINAKKNISKDETTRRLGELLSNLDVYSYDYKNPKDGKGRQTSVMAQDLEKSDIGKQAVMNTEDGKKVDYSRLLPAMLAANVDANKRITSLEEALMRRKNAKSK